VKTQLAEASMYQYFIKVRQKACPRRRRRGSTDRLCDERPQVVPTIYETLRGKPISTNQYSVRCCAT
jgi:hypothetical protein